MWINILYILIIQNILNLIKSDDNYQILSNSGNKGVAITSFTKNLYLLSSSYNYKIMNQNYLPIKNNTDNTNLGNQNTFYKNFEMVEASINVNTKESVFLIADNLGANNKINLYSFNITSTVNEQNPNLIYSTNSASKESRISLINAGIDKYLLSYIFNDTRFENIWFKYTYYEGFQILKSFIIDTNIISGMSCFLLHDQFPICFYSTKENDNKYYLKIILHNTVFINEKAFGRPEYNIIDIGVSNDKIIFTKAIYLSGNHAVFCYMKENQILYHDIIHLELNFEDLSLTSNLIDKYERSNCKNDINQIDIIKISDTKFVVGCVNSNNKISLDIVTIEIPSYNIIDNKNHDIDKNAKTTLTLFLHEVDLYNNYFGIIFDDSSDSKLKYTYLNLPFCSKKESIEILKIKFEGTNINKFKLSEYLDINIENNILGLTNINNYKIISFSANDGEHNIFNYDIRKNDGISSLSIGEKISKDDEFEIKPLLEQVFHSGKFYIEVAPVNGDITGRSCFFEFDTICYDGCSTCNKYDEAWTKTTKHNCIECKSNYYSMGDLCLEECSLIQGYYNVFLSKTCKVHELEVSNDCIYNIWSISQSEEMNSCLNSSYCPTEKPFVYNITGECIDKCRYSEFAENECLISNISGGGQQALEIIHNEIKNSYDFIFDYVNDDKINKSIVMNGHNITIEITDTMRLRQYINKNIYVSDIFNITECENKLREKYTIPDNEELIILKIDLRRNDTASTQVEYQIYNPITKDVIDLSETECKNITFKSPLWLDEDYKKKVKELYEKNFNIFDIEQDFYSDICFPYHAVDFDADLTLEKRQRVFYYFNANLCEKSCTFIDLDLNSYQAICDCPVKTSIDLDATKQDLFEFIEAEDQKIVHEEKISNIKSMKCVKYVFTEDGFRGNWGSYFMMLMILGFVIVGIIWFCEGQDIILNKIRVLLDIILIRLGIKCDEKVRLKYEELRKKYEENHIDEEEPEINNNEQNGQNEIEINNLDENNNIIQVDKNNVEKEYIINSEKKQNNEIEFIRKKGPQKNILLQRSVVLNKDKKIEEIIIPEKEKDYNLTDIEKDLLSYEKAQIMDKRTYCGYYWSLLKLRQLIIFTFFSFDDFNFFLLKLLSFFLLLSFNLVYNAIFFFDKIINEIYDDRGKYSLKLQILNIFISSILFSFTIILIRFVITCHKKLIKLKNMEDYEEAQKESFYINKCLIITYTIFFWVGVVLLIFFWYFMTCFGAIFHYTQNHCFLNAFISFCFSMIYPFIYCLIPALFRYLALKKNHERLYCFSQNI